MAELFHALGIGLSIAREILTANFDDSRPLRGELDAQAADLPDASGRPPA